jgi:hypothetical protein
MTVQHGSYPPSSCFTVQVKLCFVQSCDGVTLRKDFNDGSHVKNNWLVFNNEHGIEALFYVEERFRKLAACNFQWAGDHGADLFAYFEEDIIDPIDDAEKTAETASMWKLKQETFS